MKPIIMVDDDEVAHFILRKLIENLNPGIPVCCYSGAREPLEMIRSNTFPGKVIILDIDMPFMNGWDFLREIEKLGFRIPVYMLSSSRNSEDRLRVSEFSNVIEYLEKPLTAGKLTEILRNHFV